MPSRAIFLDRDGTIIQDAEYLADPAGVVLLPGAVEGLRVLQDAGFKLIIVSNQSGVARGFFSEETVHQVNQRVTDLLAQAGVTLAGVYYCPHYPQGAVAAYAQTCSCRKPAPGMLDRSQKDLGVVFSGSWVVGDKLSDIALGQARGLQTALVLTGYGAKTQSQGFSQGQAPDVIAPDLLAAAQAILVFGSGSPKP